MTQRLGLTQDFRLAVRDHVEDMNRKLGRGDASSYEDYLARCAEIKAYTNALRLFETVLDRYTQEEEQDAL